MLKFYDRSVRLISCSKVEVLTSQVTNFISTKKKDFWKLRTLSVGNFGRERNFFSDFQKKVQWKISEKPYLNFCWSFLSNACYTDLNVQTPEPSSYYFPPIFHIWKKNPPSNIQVFQYEIWQLHDNKQPLLTFQGHPALISSDAETFQFWFSAVQYLEISEQRDSTLNSVKNENFWSSKSALNSADFL